jgi:hypothetical protein
MATYEGTVTEMMERPWLYPGLPERSVNELLLSFSHNHSFRVWSTWHIFFSEMQYYCRRIEWARGMDRAQLEGCSPSTFGTESPMSKPKAEALIDSAYNLIRATVVKPLSGFMIDGVYCSISLWKSGTSDATSWISGRGDALALDEWLSQASEKINALLPQSSAHLSYGNPQHAGQRGIADNGRSFIYSSSGDPVTATLKL